VPEAVHRFGAIIVRRSQRRCPYTNRIGRPHLVMHKGDERGNDDGCAVHDHRRQLIAERLACTRRHHGQTVPTVKHAGDDVFLNPAKGGKAEHTVQYIGSFDRCRGGGHRARL
jgi:hypothetical protein